MLSMCDWYEDSRVLRSRPSLNSLGKLANRHSLVSKMFHGLKGIELIELGKMSQTLKLMRLPTISG